MEVPVGGLRLPVAGNKNVNVRGESMNCYDCPDIIAPAVAVCRRCGAAVCREHAHVSHVQVQDVIGTGRATHDQPLRHITCLTCRTAEAS
ncbi:DUF2180 family protein [Streptomyces sp. NPDC048324]|uniref:DUF2180 family protein n=1 Tax=Streptomyces sp. NPDC048324 TaxID=3157205 RepID=UPI00341D7611